MSEASLSHEQQQLILNLVARLKQAIEARSAALLDPLLGDALIWLFDHPVNGGQFLQALNLAGTGADDLECFILDVPNLELKAHQVALTTRLELVWTDPRSWEENEWNALMHLGLSESDGAWKIDYLGLTHPPAVAGRPGTPADSTAARDLPADWQGVPQEISYFQASPNDLFGSLQPDLSAFTDSSSADPAPIGTVPPGWVPLYLPQAVLTDMVRRAIKGV